jgi:hypothetical protein
MAIMGTCSTCGAETMDYLCPECLAVELERLEALEQRLREIIGQPEGPGPTCWLCKQPVVGDIHYQGGRHEFPSHRECLVTIERSKDGGI